MVLFFNRKTDDAQPSGAPAKPELFEPPPLEAFIPYHSHFNAHTLLTKNGELIQTIRINANAQGLHHEEGNDGHSLREAIRAAILAHVETDRLALWLHTIRRRRPIAYEGAPQEAFAVQLHNRWQEANHWKYHYDNVIYLTILHEGQSTKLFDGKTLSQTVLRHRNRNYRNRYLDESYAALDAAASSVMSALSRRYNTHRLEITERQIGEGRAFFSEPMEFINTLLHLREEPVPVRDLDIGQALGTGSITVGFNALESKNTTGKRRFAAIMTLKQYRELPPDTADRLLQAPMEFIISQSFHFVPQQRALKQYKEQKNLFDMSGDQFAVQASGIDDMLKSNQNRINDFGEQQTSIMVLSDEFRRLDPEVASVQDAFAEVGLVTIREDIRLEECFWSQLPGNFEFIRRRDPLNTARIGGFCRLNRFPSGDAKSRWGDALTILPTLTGAPYAFNFHHGDNGHTLWLDFNSLHDVAGRLPLHFLLAESRKYHGRLYVFDRNNAARLLFKKLGGDYHHFEGGHHGLYLNPFTMEGTPRNRGFLLAWCSSLLDSNPLPEPKRQSLRTAIDTLYAAPPEQRHLPGLLAALQPLDPALAKAFAPWHGQGRLAGLFDGTEENLDLHHLMHAFDMTAIAAEPASIIPVFSYLLHRIVMTLDGTPTVILLQEAWDLLENPFFAPRLESLLEMLKEHNAMAIFATSRPLDHTADASFATLMQQCATRIIIPDETNADYTIPALELEASDIALLKRMDRRTGDFLLKQAGESVALKADFRQLDDLRATFANDVRHLSAAQAAMAGTKAG